MAGSDLPRRARGVARTLVARPARRARRQHNMHEHPGEQYYFEQYLAAIAPYLASTKRVLDVGCQYGRFAVPLAAQGHQVVATDLDEACLDYVRSCNPAIEVRRESALETAHRDDPPYDVVLCLELLYLLADWREVLAGLGRLTAPAGVLAVSHRSQGYYLHRFLRDRRYDDLDALLAGTHPDLNAQPVADLSGIYAEAGLDLISTTPIGALSGIEVDPFAAITDPTRLAARDRERLMKYETDPTLVERLADSARYVLVLARH